ncbi:MAG TPA: hypothetical protein VJ715_11210 [Pyrinomonadaceae bacterium]|nr:hypothetical protein [Pyrinomonadaceae bacterium]
MLSEFPPPSLPRARVPRARRRRPAARTALWLACVCLAFGSGCVASGEISGQQQVPQTRARRVTTQLPEGANTEQGTTPTKMPETNAEKNEKTIRAPFYAALADALKARKTSLESLCDMSDAVERRVLEDYGAMFLSAPNVLPPPVCVFTSEDDVFDFQEEAQFTTAIVGGDEIELQPAAMKALQAARVEARALRLDITPRGGAEAARRTYEDTLRLWNTRFLPALAYWNKRGRLSKEQVTRLKRLPLREQVREVLELEKDGIFFSKDFSKSILYSIAAPGTSQHLAMLALDVEQFADERVRRILARHGWFQTVKSDLPHFTYLGLEERELPARGLRSVISGKQLFWIPNVGE